MLVSLVDENNNFLGSITFEEAREKAKVEKKNLILINGKTNTYKIANEGKLKYEQKQKDKQLRMGQKTHKLKEIKLRPYIDKHDLDIKVEHIREFLKKGLKTKIVMTLRGREKSNKEFAIQKFNEIPNIILNEGLATLDFPIKFDGSNLITILSPLKK